MTYHAREKLKEPPSLRYLEARGLQPKKPRKAPRRAVAVYFVKAATLGFIKIGKADCVVTRFAVLRSQSPDTLMIMGSIVADDASALERQLHRRFAAHRLHGEWFKPAPELLAYIEEHASKNVPAQIDWRIRRKVMR